ncbi:hypothetical protein GQ42DRAFT_114971, partial [Ramicandelaber brevisporus]
PSPMPAKECNVAPPILNAAMPVEAVIATAFFPWTPLSCAMSSASSADLPVPADPVIKTLSP